ncbi:MAG: glycosyltransferase, partial [Chlorobi bacterium]|nr:glycosyltransferase [Chlorobiota bacterium]
MPNKLSIIIPAYNEAETIHLLLDKVLQVRLIDDFSKEIIIVDDNSTDNTMETLNEYVSSNRD